MFKRSIWLKKYGLVPKFFLAILLFISLCGLDLIIFFKAVGNDNSAKYCHNAKLDNWDQPPAYQGSELADWQARKQSAQKEVDEILRLAEAKSRINNYTRFDYFQDYEQLMILEDKYNLRIAHSGGFTPLSKLVALRDRYGILTGKKSSTEEESFYIVSIQRKISQRQGEFYQPTGDIKIPYYAILTWLLKAYLMFMGFSFLIYLIRFSERKTSQQKVTRHNHETGRFYEIYEKQPGSISLKDELVLCPGRFLIRIIFWPFYFMKYPFYETTAEMIRYNRLKAEFLRYKPVGYQLTESEEQILCSRAKRKVKDFDKAIRLISEFEIYPLTVRKSLATAYLSLVMGIVLQPAIVFAAQYSDQVNDHFHGQIQTVQLDKQQAFVDTGHDPPNQDDQSMPDWLALPIRHCLSDFAELIVLLKDNSFFKFKELFFQIDHVPRSVVFGGTLFVNNKQS